MHLPHTSESTSCVMVAEIAMVCGPRPSGEIWVTIRAHKRQIPDSRWQEQKGWNGTDRCRTRRRQKKGLQASLSAVKIIFDSVCSKERCKSGREMARLTEVAMRHLQEQRPLRTAAKDQDHVWLRWTSMENPNNETEGSHVMHRAGRPAHSKQQGDDL